MTNIKRVLIPLDSHDLQSWQYAIGYAEKICADSHGSVQNVVLLVHTKYQLDGTVLNSHIGKAQATILYKGGALKLPSGANLTFSTMRTIRTLLRNSVIIAFFAEAKMLDFVDGLGNVAGIVVVPDLPGSADQWAARWTPIVHGQSVQKPVVLITDKKIEKALETLTLVINRANGVMNPRDKDLADQTFRILRAKGHIAPQNVKSWAIQNGWQPGTAAELEALATKIWNFTTKPSLARIPNAQARYDRWE